MPKSADHPDVLFVPYRESLDLLSVADAMRICEEVYAMHARGSVAWSKPQSFKLDTPAPLHNHWHVKAATLTDVPITGVRLYNYFNDGAYNNVGYLDCTRYIVLSDPHTGHALAIVDEHWAYAIRSAAAAVLACKWAGPANPRVLGLVGVGTMGTNALRCLLTLYRFERIQVTSRRAETREGFAREWSEKLGIPVVAVDSPESAARDADIIIGGTTSSDIISKGAWLKPGSTFISLARRELDPADWRSLDKVLVDDWDFNYIEPSFRATVDNGVFTRDDLYGQIQDLVTGAKPGRESPAERILIHTCGLVSQDIAVCHFIYQQAKAKGLGITLPAAR